MEASLRSPSADEFVDDFLSEYDDYISLAEDETESEPAHTTVGRILERLGGVQMSSQHLDTPSVLPLANTEDRAETRVDADDFVDDFLSEYDDFITLAEDETESEP